MFYTGEMVSFGSEQLTQKVNTEVNALFLHSFKQTTSHDYLCRNMFNCSVEYLLKRIHVNARENQIIFFIQRITASQQC